MLPLRRPAQTTRPEPPTIGFASTRPVLASASTRTATTQPSDQFMMNFKDAPLDVVLDYLSSKGGFTIIKEGPVDGRVNILSKYPVSRQEAVVLLDAELKANNFAAVRQGNTLKIMPRDKAMKSNIPVRYGSDPKDIPATDELVTQVMPVRNVDAAKLKDDLKPLISSTDVAANEGSNAIVITDTSANIRRIAEIIYRINTLTKGDHNNRTFPEDAKACRSLPIPVLTLQSSLRDKARRVFCPVKKTTSRSCPRDRSLLLYRTGCNSWRENGLAVSTTVPRCRLPTGCATRSAQSARTTDETLPALRRQIGLNRNQEERHQQSDAIQGCMYPDEARPPISARAPKLSTMWST